MRKAQGIRVHSVVLPVSDLRGACEWYSDMLPVQSISVSPTDDFAVLSLDSGCHLCLLKVPGYRSPASLAPYAILSVPDAAALRQRLILAGVSVTELEHNGETIQSFAFWDPDGNRIEAARFDLPVKNGTPRD